MKYSEDIAIWNTKRAKTKLYHFLPARNDEFDQEKWDILRESHLPEVESAYATIRSERDQWQVMSTRNRDTESRITLSDTKIGSDVSAKASFSSKNSRSDENHSTIRHATGAIIYQNGEVIISQRWRLEERSVQSSYT